MKRIQFDICFVGPDAKIARFCAYLDRRTEQILYVVRAGKNGKGKELAREECQWGAFSQEQAMKKIRERLNGLRFEDGS